MLIDGLHKAPLTSSGRSLPHPHALLLSLIVSSFRPCLGGAQSTAYRNVGIAKFPVDEKTGSQELPAATRRSRGGLLLRPRGTPVIELRVNHLAGGLDPKNRQCGVCEESNLL